MFDSDVLMGVYHHSSIGNIMMPRKCQEGLTALLTCAVLFPFLPDSTSAGLQVRPALQRGGSSASLHNTSLRSTIFQLMIHTLDPLGEGNDNDISKLLLLVLMQY